MTYCTEFYLKKKNHSSKLLLVNSHSFTSLMFPCSNLLGFSSFWLHCTGTRFWNQEKKTSMDAQSVSHSPEGHRLPCHFSKLTPEWKALESRISPAPGLTPEQLWHPWASLTHTRAPSRSPGTTGVSCTFMQTQQNSLWKKSQILVTVPCVLSPLGTGEPHPRRKHSHGDGATQSLQRCFGACHAS